MKFFNREEFVVRLKKVVKDAGGNKKVIAKSSVPTGTLDRYIAGASIPSVENAAKIAYACGVSVDWLINGKDINKSIFRPAIGTMESSSSASSEISDNDASLITGKGYGPMLGLASCGPDGWSRLESSMFQAELPKSIRADENAFAVIAKGQSMQPFGIYEGHLCFCSPALKPRIGDFICLERKNEDKTTSLTIKKLDAIGREAVEIIGYLPLEERVPAEEYQKLFWESVPIQTIERISVVTHIHTRPSAS